MIERDDDGLWISMQETIAQHHEIVFSCLTTAGGLTRWFPVSCEIDLREGGTIVLGWDEKMTRKTTIAILDYDPGGKVTWDWFAGPSDRHAPLYWTVEPNVERGSIVHLRQGPFASDEDAMLDLANEAMTWRWRLCNLRSSLEAKHDMRAVRPL